MAYMFNDDKSKCEIKSKTIKSTDTIDIAAGEKK